MIVEISYILRLSVIRKLKIQVRVSIMIITVRGKGIHHMQGEVSNYYYFVLYVQIERNYHV